MSSGCELGLCCSRWFDNSLRFEVGSNRRSEINCRSGLFGCSTYKIVKVMFLQQHSWNNKLLY